MLFLPAEKSSSKNKIVTSKKGKQKCVSNVVNNLVFPKRIMYTNTIQNQNYFFNIDDPLPTQKPNNTNSYKLFVVLLLYSKQLWSCREGQFA